MRGVLEAGATFWWCFQVALFDQRGFFCGITCYATDPTLNPSQALWPQPIRYSCTTGRTGPSPVALGASPSAARANVQEWLRRHHELSAPMHRWLALQLLVGFRCALQLSQQRLR